jgi:glycine cleavage system H lipoate-binding protein
MDVRAVRPGDHPVLPADALRCVWMGAGLVAYKLCDRGLDCDRCPFDAALRGLPITATAPVEERRPPPAPNELPFPDDRVYHRGHTWARPLASGAVRVGLDAVAARLLDGASSIVLPPPGSPVSGGRAGCWLVDDAGPLALRMPVTGLVGRVNDELRASPGLAVRDPYGEGWLLEIEGAAALSGLDGLAPAAAFAPPAREALARLEAEARETLDAGRATVGATACDGGERIVDLRDALGAKRWRQLVRRLLA